VELCDRHVETRGPKGIRINWGVPTSHGAASQTSRRGIPAGEFLWVLPCLPTLRQRRPRSGEKPSGLRLRGGRSSVGTRARSWTLRVKRPEANPKTTASAVCRKAQACPAGSRPHPATVSHTQSIFSPRHVEYSVHVQFHVRGSTCPWTSWDPVAFNVGWRSTCN
jgi:hypothetical protein